MKKILTTVLAMCFAVACFALVGCGKPTLDGTYKCTEVSVNDVSVPADKVGIDFSIDFTADGNGVVHMNGQESAVTYEIDDNGVVHLWNAKGISFENAGYTDLVVNEDYTEIKLSMTQNGYETAIVLVKQ